MTGTWQPIETAPQGELVLCADMHAVEVKYWVFVGWRHAASQNGCVTTPEREQRPATHWIAIPEPPA